MRKSNREASSSTANHSDQAGAYERVQGVVHFSVDPKSQWNRNIVDLALAPRDSDGKVEFSANFYILQPVDASKSNGTALVEVSNRGGKAMLNMFDFAHNSPEPATEDQLGDKFLLRRGFTLVWIGWEFGLCRVTPEFCGTNLR